MKNIDQIKFIMKRIKEYGVNPEKLAVRSMPFGALIENDSTKVFTNESAFKDWLGYEICQLIKACDKL